MPEDKDYVYLVPGLLASLQQPAGRNIRAMLRSNTGQVGGAAGEGCNMEGGYDGVCMIGLSILTVSLLLQGLRGSIPANFPYFHVEFNLTKGFVHVIDDETKFDPQFGRSIMIGLLDLPAEDMHRCGIHCSRLCSMHVLPSVCAF